MQIQYNLFYVKFVIKCGNMTLEYDEDKILSVDLLLGDCLDLMIDIPDNSVDMICCDMPYGTTNCKWDTVIDLQEMWKHYKRITKDNAAIILFAQTPFDKILGCSNLDWLRYEIIWEKPAATGFFNAKKMPMKAHENILVFYKKLPTYNPQKTYGHQRKTAGRLDVNSEVYGKAIKKTNYDSTERYPRSIQLFKSDKQKQNLHPTQKSLDLIKWLINTYSNEGDTVLDNCMGSGTTGTACVDLKRQFMGMEIEQRFFDIAQQRISSCFAGES